MFIAHAPSGYLFAVSLLKRLRNAPATAKAIIAAGVIGGLAPDLDLIYFFLIDNQQTHHHKYLPHQPWVWFCLLAGSTAWRRAVPDSPAAVLGWVFCLAGVLHILLDSVVGDIWWLAPFVDQPFALFSVPARFSPWWLSFILHWSFLLELVICGWALVVYRRRARAEASEPRLTPG